MATPLKRDWVCPMCGANQNARATDCCDYCILSIFSGYHSPDLATAFYKYNTISDWTNDPVNYSEEQ